MNRDTTRSAGDEKRYSEHGDCRVTIDKLMSKLGRIEPDPYTDGSHERKVDGSWMDPTVRTSLSERRCHMR